MMGRARVDEEYKEARKKGEMSEEVGSKQGLLLHPNYKPNDRGV